MRFTKFTVLGLLLLMSTTSIRAQHAPLPTNLLPDGLGVNIHFTDAKSGEMDMLAAAGYRWIRMDFGWGSTEREAGQYDFSAYDHLMADLDKHNIRALFILDYSNRLYDDGLSPHTDAGRAAFARWAVAAAQHFKNRGILWEMYNEPNISFWKPQPNVDDYAKLALTVGKALRENAPGAVYIGPGCSTIDFKFLEACFKAGCLEYWTAVSVHPYRQSDPETAAADFRRMRQMIAQYAPKGKHIPIISSEWGYSSAWNGFDAVKQGKMLPRQWLSNIANDVMLSIWYDWHEDGTDPKEPEHHFGTVTNEYHAGRDPVYDPKPSYLAAKTLTTFLSGATFSKRLALARPDDYALLFTQGNNVKLVVWTTAREPHAATIPASPGRFTVTAHTGGPLPAVMADTHGLAITLTDAPQYLAPEAPNDLLRVAAAWQRFPLETFTTAPANFQEGLAIVNPLSRPIQFAYSLPGVPPSPVWSLQPGRSIRKSAPQVPVTRSTDNTPIRLTLDVAGLGTVTQATDIVVTNPLRVTALPRIASNLPVRIENPSGDAFSGTISLSNRAGRNAAVPVVLKAGDKETTVQLLLPAGNVARYSAGLTLRNQHGDVALSVPASEYRQVDDWSQYPVGTQPVNYNLVPEGDAKVASEQTLTVGAPPAGPPMPGMAAFKITYRFDEGWKFLQVMPKTDELKQMDGQPKALGLWVYGDGKGNLARMRFTDATGQTFQPGGEPITWQGWRYLQFPLNATNAGFWGGAKDGVVHYPIHLDTLFLFDSANRKKQEGEVYISGPTLIY